MDYTIELNCFMILTSLMIMASIHNLIKSILLYRSNNLKISSILKIILNSSGLACGLSNIGLFLTINTTSLSECLTITYLQAILNFIFSESVIIFLVWKLRQFRKSKLDDYIVYGLLLIRSLFNIIFIAFVRPQVVISPDVSLCDNDAHYGRCFLLITTIADLLIDLYVAFRIIQYILGYSITNQSEKQQQRPQRPHSFYKLIVLNSLPILMALLYHINTLIFKLSIVGYMIKIVIFIILSYVITFIIDLPPEKVHINESNLENGNYEKSFIPKLSLNNLKEPSIPNEDIVLRASNGMLVDMPLKNVRDEIKMEQQYKIEKLDPNSDVGLLKHSLSFYEVISVLFGNDKDDKRQSS
ncbi:unnamed protein product [Rhizophagus irregularis]|uniref:Uncharacterized protein n=1 Tax=Rhizophagus irregularis TaxID=588596 RepID=A0A2N1MJ23_9GLOM|nr:hypothetical protein RhiirC2_791528 [Rhizophagus irregularis]CAB4380836.1 unnamed protein product [Rhizophagus irregularis]